MLIVLRNVTHTQMVMFIASEQRRIERFNGLNKSPRLSTSEQMQVVLVKGRGLVAEICNQRF